MFKKIINKIIVFIKCYLIKEEEKKTLDEQQFEEGLKNIIDY